MKHRNFHYFIPRLKLGQDSLKLLNGKNVYFLK